MDIKNIKKSIDEILLLNEGKQNICEGARNFPIIGGPTLEFYPNEDENEEYDYDDFYDNIPSFEQVNQPYFLNDDIYWHKDDSIDTELACIICIPGYYTGIMYAIETPEVEDFIDRFCVAEDDGEGNWFYSCYDVQHLSEKDMKKYVQKCIDREYHKATEVLVNLHKIYGGDLKGVSTDYTQEPESTGEEFDECVLNETVHKAKYKRGQILVHNSSGEEYTIKHIHFEPGLGFYYQLTKIIELSNGEITSLSWSESEKTLDRYYSDLSEPESSGEEFDESYNPNNNIGGYNEEAPINYVIEIYDIVWENDYNESNRDKNIKEYCWLDDNMLRQLYDSHVNIKKFLINESQDIAKDILNRFDDSEAIQYFVDVQNIDEVVNKIENYFKDHFEEPKEPEDDGSNWDEELQEQLNHILKLAKL